MLAAAVAAIPAMAHAQGTDVPSGVSVSFNAAIVSDYRFRGLSYTSRKPAVQGGADVSLGSGWSVGTWASSLSNYGGSNVEIDLYGGHSGSVAGLDYTATVLAYVYPGGTNTNYFELQSTWAKTIGPVTSTLTVAYYPNQKNADQNLYLNLGADVAILGTPLTATASVGRENGSYDEKWDWSAGVSYMLDKLEISAAYVDTNYKGTLEGGKNGRAGIVLSAKAAF